MDERKDPSPARKFPGWVPGQKPGPGWPSVPSGEDFCKVTSQCPAGSDGGPRRPGFAPRVPGALGNRPRGPRRLHFRRDRALGARPGSSRGPRAPTRWRLRSSGCPSAPEKATSGAGRQIGPEPQDSGHGRAAPAAKVGFLSPWRPPRASVVGVGRAAAAGPCCAGQTQPEKSGRPHAWWRTGTRRPAVSKPGLGAERSTRSLADKHPLESMPEAQNSVS